MASVFSFLTFSYYWRDLKDPSNRFSGLKITCTQFRLWAFGCSENRFIFSFLMVPLQGHGDWPEDMRFLNFDFFTKLKFFCPMCPRAERRSWLQSFAQYVEGVANEFIFGVFLWGRGGYLRFCIAIVYNSRCSATTIWNGT